MLTASAAPSTRATKSEFRVERRADGTYLLHVLGKMPIDWVSNLTSGIAHNGISITEAQIASQGAMSWHGHFILKSSVHAASPAQIDFHQLVRFPPPSDLAGIAIESFVLKPTARQLFLEVQGHDQLGFLGALLNKLSFYSLFPVRMEIETTSGRLLDRFWLSGPGGGEPSAAIVDVVSNTLQKMVVR